MFDQLTQKITGIFDGLGKSGLLREADIDDALSQLRLSLLEADVALDTVKEVVERTRAFAMQADILRSVTPTQQITKYLYDILVEMLGRQGSDLTFTGVPPHVVMMLGLQGSGKTTSTVKLACYARNKHGKNPLVASLDIYRPAAFEQLQTFSAAQNITCLPKAVMGETVPQIAKRAINAAKLGGHDVVFLDMAGRNHIDDALMLELSKVKNIAKPTESLLVADAMTGQDAVNIAQNFDKQISITGIILTRMDGDARGGAALSMHHVTGKPIKFIGVGEKADALELFQPERIAGRILGQGDIVSLVEKAQEQSDEDENQKLAKKIAKGKFDMNDLASQLQQMSKMGGLSKIMDMLPGAMNKMPVKKLDDTLIKRQVAIISSMTKKERRKPDLIHASRKKRIAAGSGTSVQEVNKLMKQFLTMSKMMKRVAGGKIPPDVMRMLSSNGGGMPPKF